MNKGIFLFLITATIAINTHAEQMSSALCSKLPGHWQGIFTVKNQNDCRTHNGCTHLIMADASYVSGNDYHVILNPAVGEGGEFNVKCENGIITSPVNPGNKITASCDTTNHCFVIYDDAMLTSEMMKS